MMGEPRQFPRLIQSTSPGWMHRALDARSAAGAAKISDMFSF
jgi:hypothetical protein